MGLKSLETHFDQLARDDDIKNRCFVCGLDRYNFERKLPGLRRSCLALWELFIE